MEGVCLSLCCAPHEQTQASPRAETRSISVFDGNDPPGFWYEPDPMLASELESVVANTMSFNLGKEGVIDGKLLLLLLCN